MACKNSGPTLPVSEMWAERKCHSRDKQASESLQRTAVPLWTLAPFHNWANEPQSSLGAAFSHTINSDTSKTTAYTVDRDVGQPWLYHAVRDGYV